jgi:hypothetical protein
MLETICAVINWMNTEQFLPPLSEGTCTKYVYGIVNTSDHLSNIDSKLERHLSKKPYFRGSIGSVSDNSLVLTTKTIFWWSL